jgi:hypothetical protein
MNGPDVRYLSAVADVEESNHITDTNASSIQLYVAKCDLCSEA